MNAEKYTQKAAELINSSQSIAREHGNPELFPAHLLKAMFDDTEGFIVPLLRSSGADTERLKNGVNELIAKLPHQSGSLYASNER